MIQSPLELYRKTVKEQNLSPDAAQEAVLEKLEALYQALLLLHAEVPKKGPRKWLENLSRRGAQNDGPRGIYIYGGVGRGKSMLMDLFYESLPEDMLPRRVHFHEFMVQVHDYVHERRSADEGKHGLEGVIPSLAAHIAQQSHILCFDEFHVSDITDAMILGRLFTALLDLGVVVIATSNWEPDRLYEGGLQRDRFEPFIELLKARLDIVHLDSPIDYRSAVIREEGSYFTPLGEITRKRIDKVFKDFIGHAAPIEEVIEVKGRKIRVSSAASGAARFTFAQLCEQPHGAEDYLAIAKRYHTVFLEGVPKLKYDRRNEAKRLMLLIDALYEAGVRLIVSADAAPERLYYGQDHGFEFQRTVSRLLEMQSAEYIEKN